MVAFYSFALMMFMGFIRCRASRGAAVESILNTNATAIVSKTILGSNCIILMLPLLCLPFYSTTQVGGFQVSVTTRGLIFKKLLTNNKKYYILTLLKAMTKTVAFGENPQRVGIWCEPMESNLCVNITSELRSRNRME